MSHNGEGQCDSLRQGDRCAPWPAAARPESPGGNESQSGLDRGAFDPEVSCADRSHKFMHFQHPALQFSEQQVLNVEQFVVDHLPDPEPPRKNNNKKDNNNDLPFLVAIYEKPPKRNRNNNNRSSRGRRSRLRILPAWISNRLTFYRLHLTYFIVISFIATFCFWLFPKPAHATAHKLSFIDSMYTAVSAACTTGLISVRMQDFSMPDNLLLMFLMTLGSTIVTSVIPLYIRQHQFRKNIHELEHHLGQCKCAEEESEEAEAEAEAKEQKESEEEEESAEVVPSEMVLRPEMNSESEMRAYRLNGLHKRLKSTTTATTRADWGPQLERKSGVDEEKLLREALAAMHLEHEALASLNWVVWVYFLASLVLGFLVLEVLFQSSTPVLRMLRKNRIDPTFFALFLSVSSVTNSGILLLNDNMVPLRESSGILLWCSFLILIGNTMFAPCLRGIISVLKSLSNSRRRAVFDYLLKNPRRCFTHLFPRNQTIWLVVTVMSFNAFESAFFYILSWKSESLEGLDPWQKVVNGIFQSITTRSAGENVVSIGGLSPSMLVLYIAMMYIAVYPVYLSRQNSQAQDEPLEDLKGSKPKKKNEEKTDVTIATQSRRLIARDSAYLFISVFALCIIENKRINQDPLNFSIFNIIFEVISAYGNVGLSVGYSCSQLTKITSNVNASCVDVPYSFSGTWTIPGKLLMIVIMLMGRHRGLPDNMDSALQIPKSILEPDQEEETARQVQHQPQQPVSQIHPEAPMEIVVDVPGLEICSSVELAPLSDSCMIEHQAPHRQGDDSDSVEHQQHEQAKEAKQEEDDDAVEVEQEQVHGNKQQQGGGE